MGGKGWVYWHFGKGENRLPLVVPRGFGGAIRLKMDLAALPTLWDAIPIINTRALPRRRGIKPACIEEML